MRQERSLIIFAVRISPEARQEHFFAYWTTDRGTEIYKRRFERNGYSIDAYVWTGRNLLGITDNATPEQPTILDRAITWHNVPRKIREEYRLCDPYEY